MVAPPNLLRLLPLSLLLTPALLLAEPAPAPTSLPPEPPHPNLRGLPPKQQREAIDAWKNSISAEQRARAKAEAKRIEDEERGISFEDRAKRNEAAKELRRTQALAKPWREAAAEAGLSESEIERLAQNRLIIEDRQLFQSFSPYIAPDRPTFITADSLLNGFHSLLNESIGELERHRVAQLRRHLRTALPQMRAEIDKPQIDARAYAPAIRQAEYVIGPALVLLGENLDSLSSETHAEIIRQVGLIRTASTQELPFWLGPPSGDLSAIDYRQFLPKGFFTENDTLADYYRAVRWLGSVGFRSDRDNEFLAAILLEMSRTSEDLAFYASLGENIGSIEPELVDVAFLFRWPSSGWFAPTDKIIALHRKSLDQGGTPPLFFRRRGPTRSAAGTISAPTIESSFLPRARLAATRPPALFEQDGITPNGLLLMTSIGFGWPHGHLPELQLDALTERKIIDAREADYMECRTFAAGQFRENYRSILWLLADKPERDAPSFMQSKAWGAKSGLTILTGWTGYLSAGPRPVRPPTQLNRPESPLPGFIEPNPPFWSFFAAFAAQTAAFFEQSGAFDPTAECEAMELDNVIRLLADGDMKKDFMEKSSLIDRYSPLVRKLSLWQDADAQRLELIDALAKRVDQLQKGRALAQGKTGQMLRARWLHLSTLASRLALIAQKQKQGIPISESERDTIERYGQSLAFVMGHMGSKWGVCMFNWSSDEDDAPRWAEIHRQPAADRGFAIGTGRPRLIHVLYPYEGREVLCTGSVLSYYEYWERDRLTDAEWKAKLDSSAAPPMPEWLTPFVAK